jgi:hydroxymethylpyrimidine pyrophosphatase-like HAD family hydrolase
MKLNSVLLTQLLMTTTTQAIKLKCIPKHIPLDLIGCDFDETITASDTIDSLGNLSQTINKDQPGLKPWTYFTEEYMKDYTKMKPDLEKKFKSDIGSLDSNASNEVKFNILINYIDSLKQIEYNSLNRINSFNYFNNIGSNDLKGLAKTIKLRPGFKSILDGEKFNLFGKFSANWENFNVVSVNWSKDFISGAIEDKIPINRIYSNDFIKNPSTGLSNGTIEVSMVDGADKIKLWNQLISKYQAKSTLFIGDSLNDLPPLLKSSYGVIIGNNTKLLDTCKMLGVKVFDDFKDYISYDSNWKLFRTDKYY